VSVLLLIAHTDARGQSALALALQEQLDRQVVEGRFPNHVSVLVPLGDLPAHGDRSVLRPEQVSELPDPTAEALPLREDLRALSLEEAADVIGARPRSETDGDYARSFSGQVGGRPVY
jgi:hypothetical protein